MKRPRVRWSSSTMPLGHPQRVVVGQRGHAGAELDVARALGGGGDEDLRRGDDLAAGRVVLADPRLVVAEAVEVLDRARGRAASASVGFSPAGWNGAMKMPNRSLLIRPSCFARGPPSTLCARRAAVQKLARLSAGGARGSAAARRRGSAPTAPRRRRTGARAAGRPGRRRRRRGARPSTSPVSGSRLKRAEPQSPQKTFAKPPSGCQRAQRSSPRDDPQRARARRGRGGGRPCRSGAGSGCSGSRARSRAARRSRSARRRSRSRR